MFKVLAKLGVRLREAKNAALDIKSKAGIPSPR
jgi:hypothetical protein